MQSEEPEYIMDDHAFYTNPRHPSNNPNRPPHEVTMRSERGVLRPGDPLPDVLIAKGVRRVIFHPRPFYSFADEPANQ